MVTIDDLKAVFARILWGYDKCDDFVTLLMGSGIPAAGRFSMFSIYDGFDRYEITILNYGKRFAINSKIIRSHSFENGPSIEYGGCPTEWQTSDGAAFAGMLRVAFLDLCHKFDGVIPS